MEQQLLRLLLDHEFYSNNKQRLSDDFFPAPVNILYKVIVHAHERYSRTLTIDELRQLVRVLNPTLTRAQHNTLYELMTDIENLEPIGSDLGQDVLEAMWRAEFGRRVANVGLDLADGKAKDVTALRELLAAAEGGFVTQVVDESVTVDVAELVELLNVTAKWKFNIPTIAECVPGVSGGIFSFIFARPECGKTASWVTLACGPGGFCEQGAKVHALVNEEPAVRTMMRAVSSFTGLTADQVRGNVSRARELFAPIKDNIRMVDTVNKDWGWVNSYVEQHKPDILIIDQLAKVKNDKEFQRTDEARTDNALLAREVAKSHDCAVFGVGQASAAAEGRIFLSMDMIAESKTGIAGEGDLIIGIGKNPQTDPEFEDMTRAWNIVKNKINGFHGVRYTRLNNQLSRYEA